MHGPGSPSGRFSERSGGWVGVNLGQIADSSTLPTSGVGRSRSALEDTAVGDVSTIDPRPISDSA